MLNEEKKIEDTIKNIDFFIENTHEYFLKKYLVCRKCGKRTLIDFGEINWINWDKNARIEFLENFCMKH